MNTALGGGRISGFEVRIPFVFTCAYTHTRFQCGIWNKLISILSLHNTNWSLPDHCEHFENNTLGPFFHVIIPATCVLRPPHLTPLSWGLGAPGQSGDMSGHP